MPLKSKKQRRFLWATDPELAREFENATPKGAVLPEAAGKAKPEKAAALDEHCLCVVRAALLKMALDIQPSSIGGPSNTPQSPQQGWVGNPLDREAARRAAPPGSIYQTRHIVPRPTTNLGSVPASPTPVGANFGRLTMPLTAQQQQITAAAGAASQPAGGSSMLRLPSIQSLVGHSPKIW